MVSSTKNNKPTTTTTSTQKTEGPATTTKTEAPQDDGPVDELQSMETADGLDQKLGKSTKPGSPEPSLAARLIKSATASDPSGLSQLALNKLRDLKPGESVHLGGKVEVSEGGTIVEGGGDLAIEKRKDGKFEVKVSVEGGLAGGTKNHIDAPDGKKVGETTAKLGTVTGAEYTFVADTPEEAAAIAAKAGVVLATSTYVPGAVTLAPEMLARLESDKVASRKLEVGLGMELAAELELTHEVGAEVGFKGQVTGAVVLEGDQAFLELSGEVELEGELARDDVGFGAESGKAEMTIRVPLGKIGGDAKDPKVQAELIDRAKKQAKEHPEQTTTTVKMETSLGSGLGGFTVEVEKTIPGYALADLKGPGWEVRVSADVGVDTSFPVGNAEAEVVAQTSVTLYESEADSVEGALKDVEAHQGAIGKDAKAARQKAELKAR